VAIAGRIKAGKSTLLNALVGERLAATDAGECTRIVTWYRHDLSYRVGAVLRPAGQRALDFRRADGRLDIDLGDIPAAAVERIEVGWPSSKLRELVLIDTPGLDSLHEDRSARTTDALLDDAAKGPGEADAVLYLMRHLHRSDAQFLEAFTNRTVTHASPVNAIVIVSRADEIGAARLDALDSARRVAARYAADRQIREMATGCVAVAGLIAETGATLQQREFGRLRAVAHLPADRREALLVCVDRFRDPDLSPHEAPVREELLRRFGLFGLRAAVDLIAAGRVRTATELSDALLEMSGIREIQHLLVERYAARAEALKARTALAGLRSIAIELERRGTPDAGVFAGTIERVEMSSDEIAALRLLHLVLSGRAAASEDERLEVDRLCAPGSPAVRTGLSETASPEAIRAAALEGVERWRARLGDPRNDRATVEAAEIVARTYERLYGAAG
jgi:predicted GTPase